MTISLSIIQNRPRVRALQQTPTACVGAALVDAMGDLVDWSLAQRNREQSLLIKDLGLGTSTTTLAKAASKARRRYRSMFAFQCGEATFAQAVNYSFQFGVVVALASPQPGRPGHAYHLLGGSHPLMDPDMPPFIQAQLQATDDMLEQLQLWDPWDGMVSVVRYGEVRRRYESAGSLVLLVGCVR